MKKTLSKKLLTLLAMLIITVGAIHCSKKANGEPGGGTGGQPVIVEGGAFDMPLGARGAPVPAGIDYGFWVYNATYQNYEMSSMGVHQFVSTGNKDANHQKAHDLAKQIVYQNIKHKALPDTIEYICVMDKMQEIRSQADVNNFIAGIQSTLPYVTVAGATVSTVYAPAGAAILAVSKFLEDALPVLNSFFNALGLWGDIDYPVAHSVAYVARYKINIDGLQIVGPGLKVDLRSRIPDSYVNESGETVIPHKLTWYQLPYYVLLHNGFFTYSSETVEQHETPEYRWDTNNLKTVGSAKVFKDFRTEGNIIDGLNFYYSNPQIINVIRQVYPYQVYPNQYQTFQPNFTFPYLTTTSITDYLCYGFSCSSTELIPTLRDPYKTVNELGNTIATIKNYVYNNLPSNTISGTIQFKDNSSLQNWPVVKQIQSCYENGACFWVDSTEVNKIEGQFEHGLSGTISFKYLYNTIKTSIAFHKDYLFDYNHPTYSFQLNIFGRNDLTYYNLKDTNKFSNVYYFDRIYDASTKTEKVTVYKLEGDIWVKQ